MDPRSVPVRFSRLKYMSESPADYLHAVTHGPKDTLAMRLGRIVHAGILGNARGIVVHDGSRRGKAWTAFKAEHDGEDIVTQAEVDRAAPMVAAVQAHPEAMRLLTEGQLEHPMQWWVGDRQCMGTPDCVGPDWIADLKTCRSAKPERFAYEATRIFFHHAQLAWYRSGQGSHPNGHAPSKLFIVAVQSKAPHHVVIHRLTERAIEQGERCWRAWFERLMVCEASNEWPGYAQSTLDLDVPEEAPELVFPEDGEETT